MRFNILVRALMQCFWLRFAMAIIDIDCKWNETNRCDCIFKNGESDTLAGEDCRVCRLDGKPYCILWGSNGDRYGPLCDPEACPPGKTWRDGKNTPGNCYCDWRVKEHERKPCPTPAGDCKCAFDEIKPTGTVTSTLPGATCVICPEGPADGGWFCTETGNRKNKYGPVCMGNELGPQCTGKNCVCNWMVTMDGPGWRNSTV